MTTDQRSCRPCRLALAFSAVSCGLYLLTLAPDGAALSGITLLVAAAVAIDSLTSPGGSA